MNEENLLVEYLSENIAYEILEEEKELLMRERAVLVLGDLEDQRAVSALIALLAHEKRTMRFRAAEALGKISDRRAVPALINLLDDKDKTVKERTSKALGCIGDARALGPLRALAEKTKHKKGMKHVVEAAKQAIVQIEERIEREKNQDKDENPTPAR